MGILDKLRGNDEHDPSRATHANTHDKPTADTPRADFSDVSGSSASAPASDERTYTVKAGDSLSRIAQQEYGDASQWQRIYEANRSTISNPDLIHPGQVLHLPR